MVDLVPHGVARGQLQVAFSGGDGHVTIGLDGEVDLLSVDTLRECLSAAIRTDGRVTLDMSKVTFIDSSGINLLVVAHGAAGQFKEAIVLVSPSPPVRRALQLCGVEELFTIIS
jgi:stage II sporulation protein AA (anti-sigma F factor antagonist)